eukprot:1476741-Rhodomonas_salina.1
MTARRSLRSAEGGRRGVCLFDGAYGGAMPCAAHSIGCYACATACAVLRKGMAGAGAGGRGREGRRGRRGREARG